MKEYVSLQAVLDIASQYCPDDDGSCSKADVDLREMLDEIESLPAADVQPIDAKEILKHLDALMICVGNAYDASHYLLESDMAFIEKQEKFIRELLSDKI